MDVRKISEWRTRKIFILGVLVPLLAVLAFIGSAGTTITDRAVEAANITHSANANIVPGTWFDGRKEVLFTGDGTIQLIHTTGSFDSVVVRAQGTTCEAKESRLILYIDGVSYGSKYPAGGSWANYRYHTKLIEAGTHTIVLEHDNSYSSASCKKSLRLSLLTFPDPATVAVGAFVGGFPGRWPGTAQALDDFSVKNGRDPAFVTWYQDWVGDSGFVKEHFALLEGHTTAPMLSWEPRNRSKYSKSVNQPEYRLSRIAAGDWDAYIRQTARDMRDYKKPVYLRFAHEMNGDWYPWGVGVNGNQPGEYVAAYRHVHDIFRQEGATNVRWVWSPNAKAGLASYDSLYPGDDYVDWVAIDGYNWGTADRGGWRSFSQVFATSYEKMTNLTSKPIRIGETASAEDPANPSDPSRKASWITDAYLSALPSRFPRVKAILWFNIDLERDWRVDSNPESLSAYRRAISEPKYHGTLP